MTTNDWTVPPYMDESVIDRQRRSEALQSAESLAEQFVTGTAEQLVKDAQVIYDWLCGR